MNVISCVPIPVLYKTHGVKIQQLVKKKVMTVNQPRRKAMKKRKKKRKMNTNLMKMKIPQRRKEDRQADNLLANLLPRYIWSFEIIF